MKAAGERRIERVPLPVLYALGAALVLQIGWQVLQPAPGARPVPLPAPPPAAVLRVASLGEPIAAAQWLALRLQSWDNQPGISIPYRELDYARVLGWLDAMLGLDPGGQYPLLMAAQLYSQVPAEAKQRMMLDFVHRKFFEDPDRHWRWLAHAAVMARHRLRDDALALRYADDIARHARKAPGWARQMRIFLLEDMGETQRAAILLGALLDAGEVRDPNEIRFLMQRMEALKNVEKSSLPTKN